eukprot:TRINITY_DN6842_c0_g1_i1.p5 TRINITY_DN6842_c0_g1~~TRINITY_DN6842_c0_g1_i1.p5  ORF type:complete len:56 (+),score=8.07 TRINITY_DN6842_c0_g1_i1:107-274(+)
MIPTTECNITRYVHWTTPSSVHLAPVVDVFPDVSALLVLQSPLNADPGEGSTKGR